MKRIGILTFYYSNNYGTVFQALALSNYLKREFTDYQVEIINWHPPIQANMLNMLDFSIYSEKNRLFKMLKKLLYCPYRATEKERIEGFELFRKKKLAVSSLIKTDGLKNALKKYDVVVVGSDQVWNEKVADFDVNFLLPYKTPGLKIAYAVSLGDTNFDDLAKRVGSKLLTNYLSDFYSLSLREGMHCKDSCSKYYDGRIANNIDPCFLQSKSFWQGIENEVKLPTDYVLYYSLTGSFPKFKSASKIANLLGCPLIHSGGINSHIALSSGIEKRENLSPSQFLYCVEHAKAIVTDAFHGFVFSLIFGKELYLQNPFDARKQEAITFLKLQPEIMKIAKEPIYHFNNYNIDSEVYNGSQETLSYFKNVL